MSPKIRLIIDCDPGIDDAVALLLAIASQASALPKSKGSIPIFDILGITTVAGNVTVETTQTNARAICELGGATHFNVFAGCPRPIFREPIVAEHVHGENGLAGVQFPAPQMPLQPQHGVDFLIETLLTVRKENSTKVALATLGPLTNLAIALVKAPQIAAAIDRVVMMGGAIGAGNVTSSAEFNLYADPHAAQIVFQAGHDLGLDLTLIPLDVTHQAIATPERRAALAALGNSAGITVAKMLGNYGVREQQQMKFAGPPLHDPCVIAYLLQPELFEVQRCFAAVETQSPLTQGRVALDRTGESGQPPNLAIAQGINADGFYRLLTTGLSRLP